MRNIETNDLEDMVYKMELTYAENVDILDVKYNAESTIGYTKPPGIYEVSHNSLMLKSLLPNKTKVNITIDDIRPKTNITTNKTIRVTERIFFLCNIRF